jgi:hypothetical protein
VRGIGERALPHDAQFLRGVLRHLCAAAIVATVGLAASTACVRFAPPADDLTVEWKLTPAAPAVDADATIELTVLDNARRPARRTGLQVEAFMAHPGMAPVIEPATPTGDGVYAVRLRFSMAGDWILSVKDDKGIRVPGAEFKVQVRGS